jgi:hypothetical protein
VEEKAITNKTRHKERSKPSWFQDLDPLGSSRPDLDGGRVVRFGSFLLEEDHAANGSNRETTDFSQ